MDAIKSVENEVDKVLRLFSTCKETCDNKIDHLIKLVEKNKQEIANSSNCKYDNIRSVNDCNTITNKYPDLKSILHHQSSGPN